VLPYIQPGHSASQEAAYRRKMRRHVGSLSTASLVTMLVQDARFIVSRSSKSPQVRVYFVLQVRMIRNELRRRGKTQDMHRELSRWLTLPRRGKV
jgi:hypothetical protein